MRDVVEYLGRVNAPVLTTELLSHFRGRPHTHPSAVRRALKTLERRGLIIGHRGRPRGWSLPGRRPGLPGQEELFWWGPAFAARRTGK